MKTPSTPPFGTGAPAAGAAGTTGTAQVDNQNFNGNISSAQEPKRSVGAEPAYSIHNLPEAIVPLTTLPNWVVWKWGASKTGKKTKVPYRANRPQSHAMNNNPQTWGSYTDALAAVDAGKADGIGFCLFKSEYAAFDIDNCRDAETGAIEPWAQAFVDKVGSYTEITISGTGLRIIGLGAGAEVQRKQPVANANGVSIETYRQTERYIVMTGNPLPGAVMDVNNIDAHIDATVAELDAQKASAKPGEKRKKTKEKKKTKADEHAHEEEEDYDTEEEVGEEDAPPDTNGDELWRTIRDGGGDRHGATRSAAVWWVINEMLRSGYAPATIVKELLDRSNHISDHIYDQSMPPIECANRQVKRAVATIKLAVNDETHKPYNSPTNIRIAVLKMGIALRYNMFAMTIAIDGLTDFGPTLDDAAVTRIWLLLDRRFKFRPTKDLMFSVIQDMAQLNRFHPVRDYLDSLKWDGTKRIDRWLTTYAKAEDTEYARAVGALMLIAAVRRIRQPGCKFDEMVIFEHEVQGSDKSTGLNTLAVKDEWFTDDMALHLKSREVIETVRGKWLIEAAELHGMGKTDQSALKSLLSRRYDRGRMVWDRLVSEVPRQSIIVGTTNHREYLRDTTGNRRYWPVPVNGFDIEALKRDRDQLWAEAAEREAEKGTSIRLPKELWPVAAVEQAKRLTEDPFYETLQGVLGDMKDKSGKGMKISADALWSILEIEPGRRTPDHSRRISEAMTKLGWRRPNKGMTVKIGNKVVVGWVKGEKPWELFGHVEQKQAARDGSPEPPPPC